MKTEFSLLSLCENLEVSPSGYYDWLNRRSRPGPRELEDQVLAKKIKELHAQSRQTYGSPRLRHELVKKGHRHGPVFRGLLLQLTEHFTAHGFTLAIISGTLRQLRLYKHLGFVPFGPVVGTGDAQFQPMHLSLEKFRQTSKVQPPQPDP